MYLKMEQKLRKIFSKKIKISFVRFFESKKNQVALVEFCVECPKRPGIKGQAPQNPTGSGIAKIAKQILRVPDPSFCRVLQSQTPFWTPHAKFIIKSYIWGDRQKEEKILKKLSRLGIAAPIVIKSAGDILFMEYIEGENLRHLYNKLPDVYCKKAQSYDELIARWLGNFHKAFKNKNGLVLLKGDMRLQNFILSPSSPLPSAGEGRVRGILYGVDFEESRPGAPEEDIAELFAVFLTQIIRPDKIIPSAVGAYCNTPLQLMIKKYRRRTKKFINIYTATVGTEQCSVLTKNIDSLVKQNLLKISEYLPHLKDNIDRIIEQWVWHCKNC